MRIPLLDGRDFRAADTNPPAAIVNQTFAKQFFNGENPVGKWFESQHVRFQVVGFVRDARSRDDMRRPIRPTAYLPFHTVDAKGAFVPMGRGTFVVRTRTANPMAHVDRLRPDGQRQDRDPVRLQPVRRRRDHDARVAVRSRGRNGHQRGGQRHAPWTDKNGDDIAQGSNRCNFA